MENTGKNMIQRKRKDIKLQSIYSRCLLTRKIVLPINVIGKDLDPLIEEYIQNTFEGKCAVEGYVKPGSCKLIRYSCGTIERGNNVVFEIVFECDVCFPVEGMLISCVAKNIVKAGIRAESANEFPSPIIVFIAKEHHYNSRYFSEVQENDIITVRIIGKRFELNDKYISIIGEIVKEKEEPMQTQTQMKNKPKLVIQPDE